MNKKNLFWIIPIILVIIFSSMLIGFNLNNFHCTIDELKCKADLLFYEQLVEECDSCIMKLTNNTNVLEVCKFKEKVIDYE